MTTPDDIVLDLIEAVIYREGALSYQRKGAQRNMEEARAVVETEIESLRSTNARLSEALGEIVDLQMGRGDGVVGDYVEDVRNMARTALTTPSTGKG